MNILSRVYLIVFNLIKQLLILLEFFLFLRFTLKFLSANPETVIVNIIYKYSDFFVSPFSSIFPDIYWQGEYLLEAANIAAMIGYAIVAFVIYQILRVFSKDSSLYQ